MSIGSYTQQKRDGGMLTIQPSAVHVQALKEFGDMVPKAAAAAQRRAINKTIRWLRTHIARAVGKQERIAIGAVRQRLRAYPVISGDMRGKLWFGINAIEASDMRGSGKTTRTGSWENVTLAQIVTDVAARNGWQPVCSITTVVPRVDQIGESDFNFITRLSKQYDCTAKVADGKLLVMQRQAGQSASGKTLGVVTIKKSDVSRWQFRFADRTTQKAVKTRYQDKKNGELVTLELGNDDAPEGMPPVHTDRHIHPNKSAAEQAAKARLNAFNRSSAAVRLEMVGRTDLFAERHINAQGFKDGLDGDFLVGSVEQVFTQAGWSTTVECNAGKKGKAKAKGKKQKKPLTVLTVP